MKSGSYINLTEFICTSLSVFYGIYLGELKILYYKVSKLCKFNLLHKYQNLRMFQLQMFLTAIKSTKKIGNKACKTTLNFLTTLITT